MSRPPRRLPRDELAETTAHGGLYLRRLMRSQLGLSLLALVAFGGIVGSLPLALYLLPGLAGRRAARRAAAAADHRVPPFPLFIAIGVLYARRAEALEEAFRDLVEPPE